ncbi:MAG TPA: allophanate hydrolase [Polyangiales bacterium]|nr:allophanate hydrolase [Polyangiales bacterium]
MLPVTTLHLAALAEAYASGAATPLSVIDQIYARLSAHPQPALFTSLVPRSRAQAAARAVMQRKAAGERMALYGVPFAVKDNIDVAELETTAACPAFAYHARTHAAVVERLLREGAIVIGKTNLDQFATGLVGVRSPYGVPTNPFDAERVPGGSSSGSAVAVAAGLCSFALGTDTAGSGRVPAAFNNVVGLKPTRGVLSTRGVVPACRSLDCVSVLALTVDDAAKVARLMAGYDAEDPYAELDAADWDPRPIALPPQFAFGVPAGEDLVLPDPAARQLFSRALDATRALGGRSVEIALRPFHDTTSLLYHAPFVAERLEAAGELFEQRPDELHPVIREILSSAARYGALDVYRAQTQLRRLRRACHAALDQVECLIVPSTSIFPRVAEVLADPLRINTELGRYTNFVNLLDLCALAVPAGLRSGLPFGITLLAKRGRDAWLAGLGRQLHVKLAKTLGATGQPLPALAPVAQPEPSLAKLAVVGAHLSGQPLNRELTELGAKLLAAGKTSSDYRLYALSTTPPKPGLVRVAAGGGASIELEIWQLGFEALGKFLQNVKAPLCIGTLQLESGEQVHGFLCESAAVQGAEDITAYGGWRAYRAR